MCCVTTRNQLTQHPTTTAWRQVSVEQLKLFYAQCHKTAIALQELCKPAPQQCKQTEAPHSFLLRTTWQELALDPSDIQPWGNEKLVPNS